MSGWSADDHSESDIAGIEAFARLDSFTPLAAVARQSASLFVQILITASTSPAPIEAHLGMSRTPQYKVLLLRVILKVQIAHSANVVNDVHRAINRNWCYPCMHSKQGVAFVILTEESASELLNRIRPRLEAVTSVENYWCHIVLEDMAARDGNVDPLRTYVAEAWEELRKRNKPEYFREPEWAKPLVIGNMENFDRGTAIKMGIKGRRPGKPL